MKRNIMIFPSICVAFFFCFSTPYTYALKVNVAFESSAGAGDFDSNILGQIESFDTTPPLLTVAAFYDWFDTAGDGTTGGSYNGHKHGGPDPLSNLTQLFLVDTSEGMSLFVVHDLQWDGSSGDADMQFDLTADTADFLFYDDTHAEDIDDTYATVGGTQFNTTNGWGAGYTDGFVIGSLDNNWSMLGQFTESPSGITGWQVVSSDLSTMSLSLEQGRRVRLSQVPIPATILLLGTGLVGLVGVRKKMKN